MPKKKPPNPSSSIADLIASMNHPLYDWQAIQPNLDSSRFSKTLEESRRQLAERVRAATRTPDYSKILEESRRRLEESTRAGARAPDLSAMLEASRRRLEETARVAARAPDLRVEYARIAAGLQAQRQLQAPGTAGLYASALKSITRGSAVSLDLNALEAMRGNHLRGLLQALSGVAPTTANPSVERPALPAPRRENPPHSSSPTSPAPKQGKVRSRLTVFLAGLPAFFEPPEHPVPKFRLH